MNSVKSAGLFGLAGYLVEVETDFAPGLPRFDIVGLPDTAVRESRDRVCAALKNCGYTLPAAKITVNLAPADLKKAGPVYDLPIFLSLLLSSGQLAVNLSKCMFVGELSLSGALRPVVGVLPMVLSARGAGCKAVFVPEENAKEAAVVPGITVYGVPHVKTLLAFFEDKTSLSPTAYVSPKNQPVPFVPDFCEVKGQQGARRALEIAAAGGHNALMIGAPGAGKSMLAKRIGSILPDMTFEESIETTMIHSVAGLLDRDAPLITARPFRSPHHTISAPGLSGGGSIVRPGEISLAHNGVLFLDELPEFSRAAMEVLRQPVEDGCVTISRVSGTLTYPCSMMVIAAMNPCPCGYYGHPTKQCTCTPKRVEQYLSRISGPLLDRLDLHIDVLPVSFGEISSNTPAESSAAIKARVDKARAVQHERFRGTNILSNAKIPPARLQTDCRMTDDAKAMIQKAFDKLSLSARAYDRILKVSRTIADLSGDEVINTRHVAEAIQYRSLDRKKKKKK